MKAALAAALTLLRPAGEAKAKSRRMPGGIEYTLVKGYPDFGTFTTSDCAEPIVIGPSAWAALIHEGQSRP